MIDNNINHLSPAFRPHFDLRRAEVQKLLPSARVFETRRSLARQRLLLAK